MKHTTTMPTPLKDIESTSELPEQILKLGAPGRSRTCTSYGCNLG